MTQYTPRYGGAIVGGIELKDKFAALTTEKTTKKPRRVKAVKARGLAKRSTPSKIAALTAETKRVDKALNAPKRLVIKPLGGLREALKSNALRQAAAGLVPVWRKK